MKYPHVQNLWRRRSPGFTLAGANGAAQAPAKKIVHRKGGSASELTQEISLATVSVAMATFNGARHIVEQLDSIARQTRLPDELVVGDDQSTDDTVELIRRFSRTAPFPVTVVVNPTRLGYRDNFLKTALACKSTYVAFSDQDDVWLPHKLEVCLDRIESTNSVLCVHTASLVSETLDFISSFRQGITGDRVIPPLSSPLFYTYYGLCQVFLREMLDICPIEHRPEDHDPFGQPISHDRWITTLAKSLGNIATVEEALILYRQHGRNVTGKQQRVRRRDSYSRLKKQVEADDIAGFARLCEQRAAIFQDYAREHQNRWTEPTSRAARYYREYAACYRAREAIFRQETIFGRAWKLLEAAVRGAYRAPQKAGLGSKFMAKDAYQTMRLIA